jgi:serine/threonine protein kinase
LYALLTGRPPFDEGDFLRTLIKVRSPDPPILVRQLRPDVPEALERICERCMRKRPADRFQSVRELADILRLYARHAGKALEIIQTGTRLHLKSLQTGEWIAIVKEPTIVGRAVTCDLVLATPDVSRCHCRIFHEAGQAFIEDLGSTRGTHVNGDPINRKPLKRGDRLKIAQHLFEVDVG